MAPTSNETILTFKRTDDEDDMEAWSMVWSTTHVPGMDMATGGGGTSRRRKCGRRRLRISTLTVGCLLSMHVRVSAASLCGGYFIFLLLLMMTTAMIGNPTRHFEVYLGQWSLSGPGKAFRILPSLEGIGLAICIHAILRAILCAVMAALSIVYIFHSTSDKRLPYSYCRTMDLKPYEGAVLYVDTIHRIENGSMFRLEYPLPNSQPGKELESTFEEHYDDDEHYTSPKTYESKPKHILVASNYIYEVQNRRRILFCNETFPDNYPPIIKTPPYNFFYVEVIHYRAKWTSSINLTLLYAITFVWLTLWILMVLEKFRNGRIIWNNMLQWFILIPWLWGALLLTCGLRIFFVRVKSLRNVFYVGGHKDIYDFVTDSFVVAIYIHASALGSELIVGKGLNHYAAGHIDPLLNYENLWHSAIVWFATALSTGGTSVCALSDYMHMRNVSKMHESSLWVFPLISKCALGHSMNKYAHLSSTLVFLGLAFSYMAVAFVCLKTALHIIFEYKVKFVFIEQVVVGALILGCMAISVLFTTDASLGLLESIDVCLAGIASPLISALELVALIYVYRSHDFMSDMHVSTEENACASRIGIMWQIVPFIHVLVFILEAVLIAHSELPGKYVWVGAALVIIMLLTVAFRGCYNAYHYLQPPRK
ncbi:hypothetical protein O0L34_g8093 [Tuta absoluta]|nr:hypothetical protein O0L34_g8093 [Tuta absoluta]